MMKSTSSVSTGNGSKYAQQMSNHFGHKAEVTQIDDRKIIQFGFGTAELQPTENAINLVAQAGNQNDLERTESILGSHLERFAFRENLTVTWTRD